MRIFRQSLWGDKFTFTVYNVNLKGGESAMAKKPEEVLAGIGLKRLSATELEYMNVIWKYPDGISSNELYENFPQHALKTKRVILHNITKKGYISSIKEGRHQKYIFTIQEKEYQTALERHMFVRKFGFPLEDIVAEFCGKKKLEEGQIQRLYGLLEELKDEADVQL